MISKNLIGMNLTDTVHRTKKHTSNIYLLGRRTLPLILSRFQISNELQQSATYYLITGFKTFFIQNQ